VVNPDLDVVDQRALKRGTPRFRCDPKGLPQNESVPRTSETTGTQANRIDAPESQYR
jgi:hypothetical protein